MGDMADYSLDHLHDETWDDEWMMFVDGFSGQGMKESKVGGGRCPKCKDKTVLKTGIHGKFFGCVNYPRCNGSRSYE